MPAMRGLASLVLYSSAKSDLVALLMTALCLCTETLPPLWQHHVAYVTAVSCTCSAVLLLVHEVCGSLMAVLCSVTSVF
jgi:hypothetical protein